MMSVLQSPVVSELLRVSMEIVIAMKATLEMTVVSVLIAIIEMATSVKV